MRKTLTTMLLAAMFVGIAAMAQAKDVKDMSLDISGVGQIGQHWTQLAGGNDSFNVNRLRVKLNAQPADAVKFYASIEAADSAVAGGAFGDKTPANAYLKDMGADSRVVDMYVTLSYLKWATILAGQMPTPISYELNTDEYALETINYSMMVGIANRDRGIGVVIPIQNTTAKVTTWALNGTGGINGAQKDIDDRSNFGAMIDFKPVDQLSFKGWANFGQMATADGTLPSSVAGNQTKAKIDAIGFGLDYKNSGFHFFGEYADAKLKVTDLVTSTRKLSAKTREWYVHGSYVIPETNVQLVARYDKYDPNTSVANDDTKIVTTGINWDFEKDVRLQIMKEFVKGRANDNMDVQLSVRF